MIEKLPKQIPVFPLSGVIYFPRTNLPLNIFEQRYLDLVNDTYKNNKFMGMVQCKRESKEVYKVGCLGRISDYQKTEDGRVIINLEGIIRFEITKEISNEKKYREFEVNYNNFGLDLHLKQDIINDQNRLKDFKSKTKLFFKKNGLMINWNEFDKLDYSQQIDTLAMIAPVSNEEKQKLLETKTLMDKTKMMSEIIEFYLHESSFNKRTIQ